MSATVRSGTQHPSDQDSAASAALKVARDASSSQSFKSTSSVLDKDGRLSAASAATSLKYARAQDLPSFPSQGGVKLASAGAAASLANENQKPFEHWKPDAIPAANKAALLAQDYKMDPLWQPELSKAGSQAAAQAHGNTTSPSIWKAPESEHGMSAANQAQATRKPVKPITERDVSASDHRKALLAATASMSGNRRRAGSAPMPPQTTAPSSWALKAANSTHKANNARGGEFAPGDPGYEAARIQNMAKNNVSRQMYGSAPPVSIEVEEKNKQAMLKASAIAMAQKMYAIQQTHIDNATGKPSDSTAGARVARNRALSDATNNLSTAPPGMGFENLQEAATRLAHERLAKLHDEHAEYRQYYGQTTQPPKSRFSKRTPRRTTSYDDSDDSDAEQSKKIRSQMSLFTSKLAEVDSKKRQSDRDALLQAAHKNVTARLNAIDEKVFSETGKSSPQQRELWERQARERAQRDSDARMVNVGRIHVGGGKYLDQSEIDAIARARLQPTLDDITDKAEKQRARDEEIRVEQERVRAEQEKEKQRVADNKREIKEQQDREKAEERAKKDEDKRKFNEARAVEKQKQSEKAAVEKERARAEKEEKRKSGTKKGGFFGSLGRGAGEATVGGAALGASAGAATAGALTSSAPAAQTETSAYAHVTEDAEVVKHGDEAAEVARTGEEVDSALPTSPLVETPAGLEDATPRSPEVVAADAEETPASPTSPTKRDSRRDSRLKTFFGRFRGKSQTTSDSPFDQGQPIAAAAAPSELLSAQTHEFSDTDKADDMRRSDSMRDVALAGRTKANDSSSETSDLYGDANEQQVSSPPISPMKERSELVAPANIPIPESISATPRDRSPSISSLSSASASHYSEHRANATTITPAGPATPVGPATASSVASASRPSVDAARTIDSEESRGRPGFRQRLLQKVKTGPSRLSKSSKNNNDNIGTADKSATNAGLPNPARESQDATRWGAEAEDALGKGNSNKEADIDEEKEKEELTKVTTPQEPGARADWVKLTEDDAEGGGNKKSLDTEDQEREELRDSFKEETLGGSAAKVGSAGASAGGSTGGSGGGGVEGSKFVEQL